LSGLVCCTRIKVWLPTSPFDFTVEYGSYGFLSTYDSIKGDSKVNNLKALAKFTFILLIAIAMIGCSSTTGNSGQGSQQPEPTSPTASEPVKEPEAQPEPQPEPEPAPEEPAFNLNGETITFASCCGALPEPGTEINDLKIEKIKELEEKYNFKMAMTSTPWGEMVNEFTTKSLAGEALGDIVLLESYRAFPALADGDFLLPIDDLIDLNDPKWPESMKQAGSFGGKQYGFIDYAGYGYGIFYNKGLFEREGLPDLYELQQKGEWTWDKFLEIAIAATKDTDNDGQTDQWGLSTRPDFFGVLMIYANNGKLTDMVNGEMKFTANSPNAMEALQFTSDLYNVHKVALENKSFYTYRDAFNTGTVAMTTGAVWEGNAKKGQIPDEFGFVYLPKGPKATDYVNPFDSYQVWVIPKTAKHPEETMKIFEEYTLWDSLEDVYRQDAESHLMSNQDVETALDMYQNVTYMDYMAYPGLLDIYRNMMNAVAKGEESIGSGVERIMPEAQAAIDAVMKK